MAFTKTKRKTIYDKYNGHCAYCGEEVLYKDFQIDHIVPKSNFKIQVKQQIISKKYLGIIPKFLLHLTEDDMNNNDNLNPSCRVCNKFKDTFHLELFRSELSKQLERIQSSSAIYRRLLKYKLISKHSKKIVFYFERKDKRKYVYDGEHHLLQFDSEEPRWFLSWVIMRKKFNSSQENVRGLIQDLNERGEKILELEKTIEELRKRKNIKKGQDIIESEKREKMIQDFNKKNNKGRNYKPKRKKRRRR